MKYKRGTGEGGFDVLLLRKTSLLMLCFGRGWIRRAFASQNVPVDALFRERVDSTHFSLCYAAKTAPSCCRSSRTYKHATGMFALRRGLRFESTYCKTRDLSVAKVSCLGGRGWIRTTEGTTNRFTVCPLWPLGNSPLFSFCSGVPEPRYAGLGRRRSSGVNEFCRLRRNERFEAYSDVELVDGLEPPTC